MEEAYVLEMTGISKTFPGAKVLNQVELKVKAGEVRALIGENGAGKSTLIKILGGIYTMDPDGGMIRICGEKVIINDVKAAQQYGISIIHQEISLVDNMTIADNLFMGKEILRSSRLFLNDKEMVSRAQKIIDDLGIHIDARMKVRNLSIAKQQMVEICRALLSNAKIIVMDEPTSSLTQSEIQQLFKQIEMLKKAGIAVVYISHRMDEVFAISDSITVLRDGELIGTDLTKNLTEDRIISMMVGRELSEVFRHEEDTLIGEECLVVRNFNNAKLKDISFSLKKGQILGFAGLVGAGRTEVARAIFGIDKLQSGELFIDGKKSIIRSPKDAIAFKIGYIPESRKTEGLFLMHSIRYNTSISVLEKFIRFIRVNKKFENTLMETYRKKLSIKMVSPEQEVRYLSGGNQQKVVLAKWIATEPDILILDEPTRGIDVGAKADIYQLIFGLAREGKAIMLISSEMEEIVNLCDEIIVMHEGRITGRINNKCKSEFRQEEIMRYASGGCNE